MLKLANIKDLEKILNIINNAKLYLKKQGLKQWNLADGYPNKDTINNDINNKQIYLYFDNDILIGVMVILFTIDENYDEIDGAWLTNDSYASIHRIAVDNNYHHKGYGVKMMLEAEKIVLSKNVKSIKIDTHKLNIPMQKTILKAGYTHCGVIKLKRTNEDNLREAYEKRLG